MHQIFNHRLLLHGSKVDNWLGLLSRGFMLPRKVVGLGGTRTDYGLLGGGIYFTDNIHAANRYTTPINSSGDQDTLPFRDHRFVVVCTVALGNCKQYLRSVCWGLSV
jgi:poly [ADP-ribose] polymerase 2/3/4